MWSAVRARITGTGHRYDMLPCQDCAEYQISEECLVCVVADGASGASLGEIGASIAVECIKQYFKETTYYELHYKEPYQIGREIKQSYNYYLKRKAKQINFSTMPDDYSATVAFLALYERYNYFICGVVGDCVIGLLGNGEISAVSDQEISNSLCPPHFISDSYVTFQLKTGALSDYSGFILTTDGCANGGLLSHGERIDIEIANAIFDILPKTQNPEIWLTRFIQKNFSVFTEDDLSMCIVYPEFRQMATEEGDWKSQVDSLKIKDNPIQGLLTNTIKFWQKQLATKDTYTEGE